MDLTHVNKRGEVKMIDVSEKNVTDRFAVAGAEIKMKPETIKALRDNTLKKGDAFAAARVAGIMAAKRTSELIPLCHPVALSCVEIEIGESAETALKVTAKTRCADRTGAEMEALTAAAVAALTIYDMAKSLDREMVIGEVKLLEKSGGKSGHFVREENE